jgi:hypothetical protein
MRRVLRFLALLSREWLLLFSRRLMLRVSMKQESRWLALLMQEYLAVDGGGPVVRLQLLLLSLHLLCRTLLLLLLLSLSRWWILHRLLLSCRLCLLQVLLFVIYPLAGGGDYDAVSGCLSVHCGAGH